ncbi:Ohr family peroxiredoxin [Deinococcus aquaticus]|uniref:Ohr family peroxiredoxin n=1 Tax=Deinococcus aquaticus TaxID=328692 RepID=UPI003622B4ED
MLGVACTHDRLHLQRFQTRVHRHQRGQRRPQRAGVRGPRPPERHPAPPQSRTEGADPEELFAAGYASCFLSALQSVARRDNITVGTPQARAHVSLHAEQGGSYHLSVQLQIHLPGTDDATAEALIHAAHATCPYSRAIAGNVQVDLELHSNPLL